MSTGHSWRGQPRIPPVRRGGPALRIRRRAPVLLRALDRLGGGVDLVVVGAVGEAVELVDEGWDPCRSECSVGPRVGFVGGAGEQDVACFDLGRDQVGAADIAAGRGDRYQSGDCVPKERDKCRPVRGSFDVDVIAHVVPKVLVSPGGHLRDRCDGFGEREPIPGLAEEILVRATHAPELADNVVGLLPALEGQVPGLCDLVEAGQGAGIVVPPPRPFEDAAAGRRGTLL